MRPCSHFHFPARISLNVSYLVSDDTLVISSMTGQSYWKFPPKNSQKLIYVAVWLAIHTTINLKKISKKHLVPVWLATHTAFLNLVVRQPLHIIPKKLACPCRPAPYFQHHPARYCQKHPQTAVVQIYPTVTEPHSACTPLLQNPILQIHLSWNGVCLKKHSFKRLVPVVKC